MIVKFMPFWSFDVIKAEEKLSRLATEGLVLTGFKPYGLFTFEQGEAEQVRYRIVREKKSEGRVPKRFIENGWTKCADSRNCYIIKNADKETDAEPSYKSWVSIYRMLQGFVFFLLCFFVGTLIGCSAAFFENIADGKKTEATPIIVSVIGTLLFLLLLLRIHHSNKKILSKNTDSVKFDFTIPEENFVYTPAEEKAMLKSKQMIKKSPVFWIAAPDKAEAMVEKMASEGWKFYRFDKLGQNFYFIKSEPCRLRFIVDWQEEITDDYISVTRESGWKLEFASVTKTAGYCIWSKEYTDEEEIPELYSDNASALGFARNYLLKMILPIVISVILYIFIITDMLQNEFTPFTIGFCIFCAVFILEYGFFAVKSLGYYLRLKKKIK